MTDQHASTTTRLQARRSSYLRWAAALLVAIPLICVGGGLFCYSRESRAIAEIEAMGGIVHHRWQLAPWMAAYVGEEPRKLLAEKSITFLDVGGNLSNVNLERLRSSILAISNVRKVALGGPSIDDGWLLHLHSLRHVRDVVIEGTQISDDGIRYLSDWTSLEFVALGNSTRLTNECLQHLRHLPKLKAIFHDHNAITEEAVENLEKSKPGMNRDHES